MWKLPVVFSLLLFTSFIHAQQTVQQVAGPEIKTAQGMVRGVTEGDVSVFKGIPNVKSTPGISPEFFCIFNTDLSLKVIGETKIQF